MKVGEGQQTERTEEFTDVLKSAGSFSEQSEGVVDKATVSLPERRVVGEGDVFTSSGQQVGGHLHRKQSEEILSPSHHRDGSFCFLPLRLLM